MVALETYEAFKVRDDCYLVVTEDADGFRRYFGLSRAAKVLLRGPIDAWSGPGSIAARTTYRHRWFAWASRYYGNEDLFRDKRTVWAGVENNLALMGACVIVPLTSDVGLFTS